jgi:hypothetical protein
LDTPGDGFDAFNSHGSCSSNGTAPIAGFLQERSPQLRTIEGAIATVITEKLEELTGKAAAKGMEMKLLRFPGVGDFSVWGDEHPALARVM